MQSIRSSNTVPERKVMQKLKHCGIYFAKHVKSIPGKPDIVFRRKKIAVFIDSDFWHGHKTRFTMPKSNLAYWRPKIERNKLRDREVNRKLRKMGWVIIRIWEYDIKKNLDHVIGRILRALNKVRMTCSK